MGKFANLPPDDRKGRDVAVKTEYGLLSVVFPVFNNLDVIRETLPRILDQDLPLRHEVVAVDDGSGPEVKAWFSSLQHPALRVVTHAQNRGRAAARNSGFRASQGGGVVFLDSDVLVRKSFLAGHAAALGLTGAKSGAHRLSIGRLTDTFQIDPAKLTQTAALPGRHHFTSANVGATRTLLLAAQETAQGPSDEVTFSRYGWEDTELERRLRALSPRCMRNSAAAGLHHCPPFQTASLPAMIDKEIDRAAMARRFLEKHPGLAVRMMTQMTPLHRVLWEIFALGGLLNTRSLRPLLDWLVSHGHGQTAMIVARHCILNPAYIRHLK